MLQFHIPCMNASAQYTLHAALILWILPLSKRQTIAMAFFHLCRWCCCCCFKGKWKYLRHSLTKCFVNWCIPSRNNHSHRMEFVYMYMWLKSSTKIGWISLNGMEPMAFSTLFIVDEKKEKKTRVGNLIKINELL